MRTVKALIKRAIGHRLHNSGQGREQVHDRLLPEVVRPSEQRGVEAGVLDVGSAPSRSSRRAISRSPCAAASCRAVSHSCSIGMSVRPTRRRNFLSHDHAQPKLRIGSRHGTPSTSLGRTSRQNDASGPGGTTHITGVRCSPRAVLSVPSTVSRWNGLTQSGLHGTRVGSRFCDDACS